MRVLVFLLSLAISHGQETLRSPCPDVFMYEEPPENAPKDTSLSKRWFGRVILPTEKARPWLFLNIVLDKKAELLGFLKFHDVSTEDNMNFRVENTDMKVNHGPVSFFVKYECFECEGPDVSRAPKLQAIRLNGKEICNADNPQEAAAPVSKPPVYDQVTIKFTPIRGGTGDGAQQCGQVKFNKDQPVPLVVQGKRTQEGQWPWHIALHKTDGSDLSINTYSCGGSLVSRRHVITAAHCTTVRNSDPVRKFAARELTVVLGKHHLITSVEGVQVKSVTKVTVYPDYNSRVFTYDLSILQLRDPAEYTAWVQPVCLWSASMVDLTNVVGQKGTVVGWGDSGTGQLDLVEMPVVDQETCLFSYDFYVKFTSPFTFCAGSRDGSSACNGDSGGGMVFKISGSWYLRGLVSVSPTKPDESSCDPYKYIVFTDLAKFLPWIQKNIEDY